MTRLCLNMIVKNEAKVIIRCLASVMPFIDCYAILDTGSTDETPRLIRSAMQARGIPGRIDTGSFVNFGDARNRAIDLAHGPMFRDAWDYLLLVDADMELVAEPGWDAHLSRHAYRLEQRGGGLQYWNVRLLAHGAGRYIGSTHEYVDVPSGDVINLPGPHFIDHADGANRPEKLERDAALLETELAADARNGRAWFYLGQTYAEQGLRQKALDAYAARIDLGGWDEETWCAQLRIARLHRGVDDGLFVTAALKAYDMRPTRAEPIHDLAVHYRERGNNAVGRLFARQAMGIEEPVGDLLFVETPAYTWGPPQEYSICANYSADPGDWGLGRRLCNALALDRDVPQEVRDLARANLAFYAKPLVTFAPSFEAQRIDFAPPTGWAAMNPSIALDAEGDRLLVVVRTVNYRIDDSGAYIMPPGETAIRTRNFFLGLTRDLMSNSEGRELLPPTDLPLLYSGVIGLEDCRIWIDGGDLQGTATARQANEAGRCQIIYWRRMQNGALASSALVPDETLPLRDEKNWMPLFGEDGVQFVYSVDPTIVLDRQGDIVLRETPTWALDHLRGGSQVVPFCGCYLAVTHEVVNVNGTRRYLHRFVAFSGDGRVTAVSLPFVFAALQIEFCCGMCWHPDGERLVLTWGQRDAEAWLGTVSPDDVQGMLGISVSEPFNRGPDEEKTPEPASRFVQEPVAVMANNLAPIDHGDDDLDIVTLTDPTPILANQRWAVKANSVLATKDDAEYAARQMQGKGWRLPNDRVKAWDNTIAINCALDLADCGAEIVDAGADCPSPFLEALRACGYRNLLGINRDHQGPGMVNGILYQQGDITRLGYATASVDFVACLSVIEHGVDLPLFFKEMARVIKPGGHLFVSTDFWPDWIDTGDRVAFGAPVKVFDAQEISNMRALAASHGLMPTSALRIVDSQMERCVEWIGLRYTFINCLFERIAR